MRSRCNGITPDTVGPPPSFSDIADVVYNLLHGRIWAGHNILEFDRLRIKEAYENIGRQAPEPKGTIDSLALLSKKFGRRAGDMKMATLANYFGLGKQTHRSMDDVVMNLEVLKRCATILFLESSLPEPAENISVNPSSSFGQQHPIVSLLTCTTAEGSPDMHYTGANVEGSSGFVRFLVPEDISTSSIGFVQTFHGSSRIKLSYNDVALQLVCSRLKVQFGPRIKFLDHNELPKLNIVVHASQSLCRVLDAFDDVARQLSMEPGSNSKWKPVVTRNDGYPTIRLNIPTVVNGDTAQYATEIHQKDCSGTIQKLIFRRFDVEELNSLFLPGKFVDVFFSLDPYDYQRTAGIRLVAEKLIIHSN